MQKRILAMICALALCFCSFPVAYAADAGLGTYWDLFNSMSSSSWATVQEVRGSLPGVYVPWATGSTSNSKPTYEIGGGAGRVTSSGAQTETVYNSISTTRNYQVLNTTNNTWYNPVTNNYNTYNNITYNNEYNTYKITNEQYNTFITNNYTYVSYFIQDTETASTWYYEIYYQLPDGRNTWNMTRDEVWGLGLSYDAVNYDVVAESNDVLGLWHFDGNLLDSSTYERNLYFPNWVDPNYTYIDSSFTSALYFDGQTKNGAASYYVYSGEDTSKYTFEGRMKYDASNITGIDSGTSGSFSVSMSPDTWGYIPDDHKPVFEKYGLDASSFSVFDTSVTTSPVTITEVLDDVFVGSIFTFVNEDGTNYRFLPVSVEYEMTFTYTRTEYYQSWGDGTGETRHRFDVDYEIVPKGISLYGVPSGRWFTFAIVNNGTSTDVYIDGVKRDTYPASKELSYFYWYTAENAIPSADRTSTTVRDGSISGYMSIAMDELRLSKQSLYNSTYVPSSQPFDTNKVFVLPEAGEENQIAVKSSAPVTLMRIGGVRPSYPTDGYLYVYLENGVVLDVQQYQTDGWYSVDAAMYRNGQWVNLKGLDITDITIQKPETDADDDTGGDDSGGSSSGDTSGGSTGGSSNTENTFTSVLDTLLGGVLELFSTVLGFLLNVVFSLFGWVVQFLGFINTSYLGGFFPAPVWGLVCIAVPLVVVLALVRFLRGFF